MKISRVEVQPLRIPLKKPFTTARRRVTVLENVLIAVHADTGEIGFGEAPAAAAVTGETTASITEAVLRHLSPAIIGLDIPDLITISDRIKNAIHGNPSAKAAVECAVYDLYAQRCQIPLFRVLGSPCVSWENDITVSAGDEAEMISDCLQALREGYVNIKIKLGKTPETDAQTLLSIGKALDRDPARPYGLRLRVDANQGWNAKEAVRIIRLWEDANLPLAMVEQPVPAWDVKGLRLVTRHTDTTIIADESVFDYHEAARILEVQAADMVNIKLAKAGGISCARKIAALCEVYGVECLMGCMLESRLGAAAAAHTAASCENITLIDLDGPALCASDPFTGGAVFDGPKLYLTEDAGLGLRPAAMT